MYTRAACPECLRIGRLRLVSRSQLEHLARTSDQVVLPWPAAAGLGYWWCDACSRGGAFYRWTKPHAPGKRGPREGGPGGVSRGPRTAA